MRNCSIWKVSSSHALGEYEPYLLELVDTEDTPGIFTMGTGLLSKTSAITSILNRQVLLLKPLAVMQRRQRLLRSSNQVLIQAPILALRDLVQLLVELRQLRRLGHDVPQHEERRHIRLVALVEQEFETVVDQREVEEEAVASQTVATVANDLDTALGIIAVETSENFVMGQAIALFDLDVLRRPGLDDGIVVLRPVRIATLKSQG